MTLAAIELATGLVFGAPRRSSRPAPAAPDPRAALEAAVLPVLRRGPCLVSFSGGLDSSLVLAVATRVARHQGLPDPIPATNRVNGAPAADESAWQEAVVAHLGLADWLRLEWQDELDAVGPVAREVMARHGLLWPCNAHFHQPLLAAAAGGSLLTGIGGDELFRAACPPLRGAGRRRRALRFSYRHAPWRVRREVLRRRDPLTLPWLTAQGDRAATLAAASHHAGEPDRPGARLAWARQQRYLGVGVASLDRIAGMEGATIAHPLLDGGVWAAMAAAAGRRGYAGRADALARLFGGLLPDALLGRRDKASFDEVFCGPRSVDAAARYDGAGAPAELIDAEALRDHWAAGSPMPQSLLLLQAAALAELDLRPVVVSNRVVQTPPVS